jgi:hypothetical protein
LRKIPKKGGVLSPAYSQAWSLPIPHTPKITGSLKQSDRQKVMGHDVQKNLRHKKIVFGDTIVAYVFERERTSYPTFINLVKRKEKPCQATYARKS